MTIRRVIGNFLRSLGYQAVKLDALDNLSYAVHVKRLVRLNGIDCVFDVGANLGQFRDLLREQVLFPGPIISYEPISSLFDDLKRRSARDPHWHVRQHALGDVEEFQRINVMKSSDLSSFLIPSSKESRRLEATNVVVRHEEVLMRRLNSVYPEEVALLAFNRPFLKIDTQGYDLKVIEGARDVLDHFVLVQMEVPLIHIYETTTTLQESMELMMSLGFEPSWVSPVAYDDVGRAIELDILFVNLALAAAYEFPAR